MLDVTDSRNMASAGNTDDLSAHPPSATIPDWSRESKPLFAWSPSRSLLASIRTYQRCRGSWSPFHILTKQVAVLRHRFWSVVTGADIPLNSSNIAGGLELPHPNGIVIHPASEIGPNCIIFQQATLAGGSDAAPRLGGNVSVGSGAKLLGGVRVGDNAQIGANAVVLQDVPAGATAVGVPARIIPRQEGRTKLPPKD